jgi:hypothetical protein
MILDVVFARKGRDVVPVYNAAHVMFSRTPPNLEGTLASQDSLNYRYSNVN